MWTGYLQVVDRKVLARSLNEWRHSTGDDDDEIAYSTVRWKTRASFVYRTKTSDNTDKDSKNRKRSH